MSDPILQFLGWLAKTLGLEMGGVTYVGVIRVAVALVFFTYVGYLDLKSRKIPRTIDLPLPESLTEKRFIPSKMSFWAPIVAIAFVLLAWEMANSVPHILWPRIASNIAVATGIGLGMYMLPKIPFVSDRWTIFHMGDLKAILVLGLLIPTYPYAGPFPIFRSDPYVLRLFIISILQWTAVIGAIYAIGVTALMLARSGSDFEFPESLLGYRVSPDSIPENTNRRVLHEDGKLTFNGLRAEMVEDYLEWRNDPESGVQPVDSFSEVDRVYLEQFFHDTDWGEGIEDAKDEYDRETIQEWLEHDEEYMLDVAHSDKVWVLPDIPLVTLFAGGLWLASILGDPMYIILLHWPF